MPYILNTSPSGKEIEENGNAHVVYSTYKIISSSRDSDDSSIDFHRSIDARERKLTNNETTKGNYHVRNYLKDVSCFAEHQDKCTYGLGYKLTSQKSSDNHVLSHPAGANGAANHALAGVVTIDDISLYVPQYTPIISNQRLMFGHFVCKAATELSYIQRSSNMKDVTTESKWTF